MVSTVKWLVYQRLGFDHSFLLPLPETVEHHDLSAAERLLGWHP
jgi:hypothetical protein